MARTKQLNKSAEQIDALLSNEAVQEATIAQHGAAISGINGKIPNQATSENQLADKAFVNSTVQTGTANFRGAWNTWADVPTESGLYPADYAGSKVPTVNDYLVVQDASGFGAAYTGCWRFKYSGTWSASGKNGWLAEYRVNEEPLTAAQVAALNSGVTATVVAGANALIPAADGSIGQVLTKGASGTQWQTPAVSGQEAVTLQLAVASGSGSVSGVSVSVAIDGGSTTAYTTDASGKCSFSIASGAIYNISCGAIDGYVVPDVVSVRSTLAARTVTITYHEQTLMEHVVISCWYDSIGTARASAVNVTALGSTTAHALVNNRCEFNIPLGAAYTIQYEGATGYDTPASVTVTASKTSRDITARYISTVNQMCWIKTDGSVVPFTDLISLQEEEVFGVRIQTSALSGSLGGNCSYVIPWAYLVGSSAVGQKMWCTQNVQFNSIGLYGNESAALTDDGTNFDGQANTLAVKAEALNRGLSVPAFDAVQGISYSLGGVTRQCFLGSYAQVKAFGTNRVNIDAAVYAAFGKNVININSGLWWTSTQYSATLAVNLTNGGFSYDGKTGNRQVVPFLAY